MTQTAQGSATAPAPPPARTPSEASVQITVAAPTAVVLDVLTSPERFPGFLGDVLDARIEEPDATSTVRTDAMGRVRTARGGVRALQSVQVRLRLLHEPLEARWVLTRQAVEPASDQDPASADTHVFDQQVVWMRVAGETLASYEMHFVVSARGSRSSKLNIALSLALSSEYPDTLQRHVTLQHVERVAVQVRAEAERRQRRR